MKICIAINLLILYTVIELYVSQLHFNFTGCIVYQWDVLTRKIMNKLDCSKLIPCSESLKSISIEERLSPGKCQVFYIVYTY